LYVLKKDSTQLSHSGRQPSNACIALGLRCV